jgi:hypothetical protein
LGQAIGYLKQMVVSLYQHPHQILSMPGGMSAFGYILPLLAGDWWIRRDERNLRPLGAWSVPLYVILIIVVFDFFIKSKVS